MRHDPQRVLGKNVEIAHLPLVATKGTSREWQTYRGVEMGVQTLFPFLKAVTEDSNLTIFYGQVAVIDASCWTQKSDNRR